MIEGELDAEVKVIGFLDALCDVGYAASGLNVLTIGLFPHYQIVIESTEWGSVSMSAERLTGFLQSLRSELGENRLSPSELWQRLDSFNE